MNRLITAILCLLALWQVASNPLSADEIPAMVAAAASVDDTGPAPGRMEWFQDMKFGLFLHWGIYSEFGCIESWPLVWADRKWSNPNLATLDEMLEFRRRYWALNKQFNPAHFQPEQWVTKHQPHVIIVDRTVGRFEDYRTPEQKVPDKPLDYYWETCMTMGDQWSYEPDDEYKSSRQLIQLLVDIVAKGGNFLLNIGPKPDGTLPEEAVSRLEDIGRWMQVNAQAIHGTRPIAPYKEGRVALTSKGDAVYAIYLAEDGR